MNELSPSADLRIQKSRARLQEGLLELLANRRFDDITVAEIVERSGVGYATFYRHYEDKQALWAAMSGTLLAELRKQFTPGVDSGDYLAGLLNMCRYIAANKAVYHVLMTGGAKDRTLAAMLENARSADTSNLKIEIPDLPPTAGSAFAVNAMLAMLVWWMEERPDLSPEAIANIIDRLVYQPLFSQMRVTEPVMRPA